MRLRTQILLVPLFLAAALAPAQQQPPYFSHIVIIFQENRTPDNLFGSGPSSTNCTQENPFEPGVDIVDGGPNKWSPTGSSCYSRGQ
jgi:phospholipase C